MTIDAYFIGGYSRLFYWCLLMTILLVPINGYSIGAY
jgi:hypothetical protein